jgi:toxin ParE1/3/4
MPHIHRTKSSLWDYREIWDFIAQDNPNAADQLLREFDERLLKIADAPFLARSVETLAPNLRCSPVGNYLLFFRPETDGIQLLRALHGRRDIHPEFFSGE